MAAPFILFLVSGILTILSPHLVHCSRSIVIISVLDNLFQLHFNFCHWIAAKRVPQEVAMDANVYHFESTSYHAAEDVAVPECLLVLRWQNDKVCQWIIP